MKTEVACNVEILRMDGVRVLVERNVAPENNSIQMDLSDYPSGVYLIRVNHNGRMATQKIVRL